MLDFAELYNRQADNQVTLLRDGKYDALMSDSDKACVDSDLFPFDSPQLASYHVQQLVSEIGEVLDADKRWKNFRGDKFDPDAKLDELADCFIVIMNMFMFSGFTAEQAYKAILTKVQVVNERISSLAN